jgi:fucose 4-O-acetylase-like acetyltransferase
MLRAFGVMGVIAFHAAAPAGLLVLVMPWLYAVFFCTSGYTYKDEYTLRPWILARKRFFSLYVPLVGWQLAYLAMHNVFFNMSILSDKAGFGTQVSRLYGPRQFYAMAKAILLMRSLEDMGGALWFVISLLTVNLLFCLVSVASTRLFGKREWTRVAMIVGLAALGASSQSIVTYPPRLNFSLFYIVFFYAGYLYRRWETHVPTGMYPAIISALVLFAGRGMVFVPGEGSPLGLTLTATVILAGVYLLVVVSKALGSQAFLEYVGRNSLAIVAMHFLAFKLVSLVIIRVEGLPSFMLGTFPVITGQNNWWLAYAVVGLLVPVAAKLVYDTAAARIKRALSVSPTQAEGT